MHREYLAIECVVQREFHDECIAGIFGLGLEPALGLARSRAGLPRMSDGQLPLPSRIRQQRPAARIGENGGQRAC